MERERADRSLFVQELLLSTLVCEESSSSDEDDRGEMADFGAMGCVDIMPLDVALENLHLKESNKGNELHHLLFDDIPIRRQCPLCCICQ